MRLDAARRDRIWLGRAGSGPTKHGRALFINQQGGNMQEKQHTTRYPEWKEARDRILSRVQLEGYGILISMQELHDYMEMKPPGTIEQYKKYQFQWLGNVENLKDSLLEEHNICMMNSRGEGYIVCTPDDQVSKAYTKIMKKARLALRKAINTLTNVNQDLLSNEGSKIRLENMAKVAFIKQAMNKRKIELEPEKKQIAG